VRTSLTQVTTADELDPRIQQRANRGGIPCERRPRGDGRIDSDGIYLRRDRSFGRLQVSLLAAISAQSSASVSSASATVTDCRFVD
jgi:hypothetical protein